MENFLYPSFSIIDSISKISISNTDRFNYRSCIMELFENELVRLRSRRARGSKYADRPPPIPLTNRALIVYYAASTFASKRVAIWVVEIASRRSFRSPLFFGRETRSMKTKLKRNTLRYLINSNRLKKIQTFRQAVHIEFFYFPFFTTRCNHRCKSHDVRFVHSRSRTYRETNEIIV